MSDPSALIVPGLLAAGAYVVFLAARFAFHGSPLQDLPGPPRSGWLPLGHFPELFADDDDVLLESWERQYGHVLKFEGIFNKPRLVTTDLKALNHILMRGDTFQKPKGTQEALGRIFGKGLLVAEGAAHRAQRKVINPAFGPGQVRDLSGIFLDKANELREVWQGALEKSGGRARVNAVLDFTNATLDIIGLAGFGYNFGALSRPADDPSELSTAFSNMFGSGRRTLWNALEFLIPVLRNVPTKQNRNIMQGRRVLDRIGKELLAERKLTAAAGEKSTARDLLSLLVRANMEENAAHRLSDDLVVAQIPTFMLAGHETTSTALAWAVYALSQRPDIQEELREELRSLPLPTASSGCEPLDQDTLSALDKLPLLDAVVRETMRLYAPVPATSRAAVENTSVPLCQPFVDRRGNTHDSITLARGDMIIIPIHDINRSTELWGPDAAEWNPHRWLEGSPETARHVPGVWSHMLTFLGGSHSCVGFRFSLLETKIIMHAVLSVYQVELAVPVEEIGRKSTGIVTRPGIKSEKGSTVLPVFISRAKPMDL